MKLSKLATLCKKCRQVNVAEFKNSLWLATTAAMYRIDGDVKTDNIGLCSLLDIPESARDRYAFNHNQEAYLNGIKSAMSADNDIEAYKLPIEYSRGGSPLEIYATESGVIMFDKKLIDVATTKDSYKKIVRADIRGGYELAVWNGELQAIIAPLTGLSENELRTLTRFVAQVELARQNEMLVPEEDEQVEIDDYPFDVQENEA